MVKKRKKVDSPNLTLVAESRHFKGWVFFTFALVFLAFVIFRTALGPRLLHCYGGNLNHSTVRVPGISTQVVYSH